MQSEEPTNEVSEQVVNEIPVKKGGRRSRKINLWAKSAGEYYRAHKNDPKIKEFSDVLKSPDFKAYYQSKYGKGKKNVAKAPMTKKRFGKKFNKKPMYEEQPEEKEEVEEMKEPEYEEPKKEKKNARKTMKSHKEESGWRWGGKMNK